MWINEWLAASYVDNVENLSTANVDESLVRSCYVESVENLSTANVEN